jgi:hypothetical protein
LHAIYLTAQHIIIQDNVYRFICTRLFYSTKILTSPSLPLSTSFNASRCSLYTLRTIFCIDYLPAYAYILVKFKRTKTHLCSIFLSITILNYTLCVNTLFAVKSSHFFLHALITCVEKKRDSGRGYKFCSQCSISVTPCRAYKRHVPTSTLASPQTSIYPAAQTLNIHIPTTPSPTHPPPHHFRTSPSPTTKMVSITHIRQSNAHFASTRHSTNLVCVFAGATSGIGHATLQCLAALLTHSTFYIFGRNQSRHESKLNHLKNISPSCKFIFLETQLSLISDIDNACARILAAESKLDILCLSPGGMPFGGAVCKLHPKFQFPKRKNKRIQGLTKHPRTPPNPSRPVSPSPTTRASGSYPIYCLYYIVPHVGLVCFRY